MKYWSSSLIIWCSALWLKIYFVVVCLILYCSIWQHTCYFWFRFFFLSNKWTRSENKIHEPDLYSYTKIPKVCPISEPDLYAYTKPFRTPLLNMVKFVYLSFYCFVLEISNMSAYCNRLRIGMKYLVLQNNANWDSWSCWLYLFGGVSWKLDS